MKNGNIAQIWVLMDWMTQMQLVYGKRISNCKNHLGHQNGMKRKQKSSLLARSGCMRHAVCGMVLASRGKGRQMGY
jgi:hypothetical protein